jgi:hypothetical protein
LIKLHELEMLRIVSRLLRAVLSTLGESEYTSTAARADAPFNTRDIFVSEFTLNNAEYLEILSLSLVLIFPTLS